MFFSTINITDQETLNQIKSGMCTRCETQDFKHNIMTECREIMYVSENI
jgi:hypothetical protein